MHAQLIASIFGFLTTSSDSLLTRRKEMEHVWKRPVTFVRCLFILARYLAFSIHIVNIVFASLLIVRFSGNQPTHDDCLTWLFFEIFSTNTMGFILELILSIRVFALYEQSLKIGVFLWMMLVGRMTGSIYLGWIRVSEPDYSFSRNCIPMIAIADRPNRSPILVFILGEIVIHLIIHGLALKRTAWDFRPYTLSQPPLVSMLNRDGLRVFVAITVGAVAFGVTANKGMMPALFSYPLFVSLVSTLGCRTILNLQMLDIKDNSSPKENTGYNLSTINNSATWDTATRSELDIGL